MVTGKEIHQNAVDHGWWDEPRSLDTLLCLIHSEVSEALEEYRKDKIDTYFTEDKPEGFWVEIADLKIRVSDTIEGIKSNKVEIANIDNSYTEMLSHLHFHIGLCQEQGIHCLSGLEYLSSLIDKWAEAFNININELVELKHEYNKTRPYRHGNKTC